MPTIPPVWGDTNVIRQVLYELLSNALTFVAPNHKLHVRVWAQRIGGNVRLWIGDNGIGISAEHLERIFGLFEQLSHERRSGTGMGLAIARKGVERMGGQLGAESSPEAGSRFWLDLPAVMEEQG
jgi:signal transduction histidine kinase